ncbi:MAG: hypothetical protein P9L88_05300 [Candidatus Tantalella remota]|nr:hypothetical protein [Candidatus Tantalella remota]
MTEGIDGLVVVENEDEKHIELYDVRLEDLDEDQLRGLWLELNQKSLNEQMENIRMINQQ